jgi:VanZ family protein
MQDTYQGGSIRDLRPLTRLALAGALTFILVATLSPTSSERPEFAGCFICGTRAWADIIANVLLYAPLGAALALAGWTGTRPVVFGFVLSCVIEFAQILIPGRDPSLTDVCCNTIGAAAGQGAVWLVDCALLWKPQRLGRLSLLAAGAALGVFTLTARLLAPAPLAPPFTVSVNAAIPEMSWYRGRVLGIRSGGVMVRPGRVLDSTVARGLLEGGDTLDLDVIAGPPVRSLAPMFLIQDRSGEEVLLVGPDRDDLVLRYRPRAALVGLDRPDVRLRHAFAGVSRGDTLHVTVRRVGSGACLSLNAVASPQCSAYSLGSGWALIFYPRHLPAWMISLLEASWVAGLSIPIGLWASRRHETGIALAVLAAGLFVIPSQTGLAHTPVHEVLGAGLGVLSGRIINARLRATRLRRSAG